jgi:hypothetical protein
MFFTSQLRNLRYAVQLNNCEYSHRAIPGVYRQLSSEYLNFSNAKALSSVHNLFVAQVATRVLRVCLLKSTNLKIEIIEK